MLGYNTKVIGNKIRIHGKQINYFDVNGSWKSIDCTVKENENNFEVTEAPFICDIPKTSEGVARFINNNRYDVINKSVISDPEFITRIRPLNINQVPGELFDINGDGRMDAVIFKNAYSASQRTFKYRLTYNQSRPKISKRRRGNATRDELDTQFETDFDAGVEVNQDQGFHVKQRGSQGRRGSGIKEMKIWDYSDPNNPREEIINATIKKGTVEGHHILKKTIPDSFFLGEAVTSIDLIYYVKHGRTPHLEKLLRFTMASGKYIYSDAVFTFNPDPHVEITSVDGVVAHSVVNISWATVQGGAGNFAVDNSAASWPSIQFFADTLDWRNIFRSILLFDTSSLPDDIAIGSAKVGVYVNNKTDGLGILHDMAVFSSNPASNTALVPGDYNSLGSSPLSNIIAYNDITTGAYNIFNLDSAGIAVIDPTGITKLGLRNDNYDAQNNEPSYTASTISNIITIFAESATSDPYLEIETAQVGKLVNGGLTNNGLTGGRLT